jgi:hypothetical protein
VQRIVSLYLGRQAGAAYAGSADDDLLIRLEPGDLRAWDFAGELSWGPALGAKAPGQRAGTSCGCHLTIVRHASRARRNCILAGLQVAGERLPGLFLGRLPGRLRPGLPRVGPLLRTWATHLVTA